MRDEWRTTTFYRFSSHSVILQINPARTFGPALVNSFAGSKVWSDAYWIYFLGPFTASVVAAVIYKFLFAEDDADDEAAIDKAPTKDVDEPAVAAGGEDSA